MCTTSRSPAKARITVSDKGFAPLRALGIISGTSMDGIDLALVETDGAAHVRPLGGATLPWPEAVHVPLLAVVEQARAQSRDPGPCVGLEVALTDAFAGAVRVFLDRHGGPAPEVIGLHGQTVWHRPKDGVTRQLGDGARLAAALGLPVVDGFRQADVGAGGQGAPLAPLYHAALAGGLARPLAVLNLGGVGNVTWLGAVGEVVAFDTGPGSAAMDDLVRARLGKPFDRDGALAASGRVDPNLVGAVLASDFFSTAPPKSLDRNDFHTALSAICGLENTADALATLAAVTVESVAAARAHFPAPARRWLVCGGGRRNARLMNSLRSVLEVPVDPVEAVGWDGDLLEAQCFAYLAVRSLRGMPLSLPSTTGVPQPLPGGRLHDPA